MIPRVRIEKLECEDAKRVNCSKVMLFIIQLTGDPWAARRLSKWSRIKSVQLYKQRNSWLVLYLRLKLDISCEKEYYSAASAISVLTGIILMPAFCLRLHPLWSHRKCNYVLAVVIQCARRCANSQVLHFYDAIRTKLHLLLDPSSKLPSNSMSVI